jgi:hypothetical protein
VLHGSIARHSLCSLVIRVPWRAAKRVGLFRKSEIGSCYSWHAILQLEAKVQTVPAPEVAIVVAAAVA